MSTITPLLISREEAAKLLGGISLRHLDRLCAKGDLAKRRVGGRAMIVHTSIEEYVSPPAPDAPDAPDALGAPDPFESFDLAFPSPPAGAEGSRGAAPARVERRAA